ncbi:beta-ketoacyl synthase [Nocardia thailandica]|uniref:Beta-ketoacyl synthase n=1 Tax=Nocardia thailandica TaxID=257275 RepID=A0ABW6PMW1_9NOCA
MTVLEFDGIAFDPVGARATTPGDPGTPTEPAAPAAATRTELGAPTAPGEAGPAGPGPDGGEAHRPHPDTASAGADPHADPAATAAAVLAQVRAGLVTAHETALAAQSALQRSLWQQALAAIPATGSPSAPDATAARIAVGDHDGALVAPVSGGASDPAHTGGGVLPAPEGSFKPLARTPRRTLDAAALALLTQGAVAEVFGPAHRRSGLETAARLADGRAAVLTEVLAISPAAGESQGRVVARFRGDAAAAAREAAELFALFTGQHLAVAGSRFDGTVRGTAAAGEGIVEFEVGAADLVPRPFVRGTARAAGSEFAVEVVLREPAGQPLGPGLATGDLLLSEFHMTHLARGDQAIALGPEFAPYTGVRATRLPTGGLLLVDRVLDFDGERGRLDTAAYTSEYDSPADSWYYADTANESLPHFVYMETSLQAALLMGYYAGPTLTQPGTTLSLRNLGGTATVLRRVDLRDKTIHQRSRMLSTTILPGSSLQTFDYTLSADGEPFYRGETMFGYFSDEALANQTGLDAGRPAPSWLSANPGGPVRVIDVAARRADPAAPLCARRALALIDTVEVVDGGGRYGEGYLHSLREIDPSDWYFERHFHLDPVIPGSLGVESVIHAVQEWILDAGFAEDLTDPVFSIPAGIEFTWRYRGQFLPTDGTVELEAHIKEVRRGPRGVTVLVDASLWKPGLRIYELLDLGVELTEREHTR